MSQENVEIVKGLFPPNRELHSDVTAERRDAMRAVFEPLIAPAFSVNFVAAGFTAFRPRSLARQARREAVIAR
jgi:hypothetical protein